MLLKAGHTDFPWFPLPVGLEVKCKSAFKQAVCFSNLTFIQKHLKNVFE